jgi:hypothetical protein
MVQACRDAVVPLLGTVHALLLARGGLARWPAVESALHASVPAACGGGGGVAAPCPLRKVREEVADSRLRVLVV